MLFQPFRLASDPKVVCNLDCKCSNYFFMNNKKVFFFLKKCAITELLTCYALMKELAYAEKRGEDAENRRERKKLCASPRLLCGSLRNDLSKIATIFTIFFKLQTKSTYLFCRWTSLFSI